MTVATWLRRWLITQEEVRGLRAGTIIDYRRHIGLYWIPRIGHLKLTELRSRHVTDALAAIRRQRAEAINAAQTANAESLAKAAAADELREAKGLRRAVKPERIPVPRPFGAATAQRVHATLRAALNAAVRAEEIPRNVAVFADRPVGARPRIRPWEPEQLGAWLDSIVGEQLYPLYHLGAFGGLRRGELCGLGWSDLDLRVGRVVVRWQITGVGYRAAQKDKRLGRTAQYRTKPKTRDGEDRIVDLDDGTVQVLRAWRRQQATERLAWGTSYDDGDNLVFTKENGTPLDPDQVYKHFVRLVSRSGLPTIPLHHLRHGSASLQIAAGVDIAVVSKRLGHSKIDLTSDTYGHLIGTAGKNAAEAAAALVPRRQAG